MKVETERFKAIEVTSNEHKTTDTRQLDAPLTEENGISLHGSIDLNSLY